MIAHTISMDDVDKKLYRYCFGLGRFMQINASSRAHAVERCVDLVDDFNSRNLQEWTSIGWENVDANVK